MSKKQPLSCPSDIKRFFVTPEQSGQICILATFIGNTGNVFFPKLDFYKDQVYFKDTAFDFLKEKGYEPVIVSSEEEAKSFDIDGNPGKYPIYLFKTDTSGEKTYEEFYTESDKFELEKYHSLGFISTKQINISFNKVIEDFEKVFNNSESTKRDIVNTLFKYVPDFDHIVHNPCSPQTPQPYSERFNKRLDIQIDAQKNYSE